MTTDHPQAGPGRRCASPLCRKALPADASARRRYCSGACRQAAWRIDNPVAVPAPARPSPNELAALEDDVRRRAAHLAAHAQDVATAPAGSGKQTVALAVLPGLVDGLLAAYVTARRAAGDTWEHVGQALEMHPDTARRRFGHQADTTPDAGHTSTTPHHDEDQDDKGDAGDVGGVRELTAASRHARLAQLAAPGRPAPLPEADPTPTIGAAAPSSAREPTVEEPAARRRGSWATPASDDGQALTEVSGEGLAEGLAEHARPVDPKAPEHPAAPASELYLASLDRENCLLLVDGARVGWLRAAPDGWQVHDAGGRLVTTLPADDAHGHGVVVGMDLTRRAAAALGVGGAERAGVTTGPLTDDRGRSMDTSPAALASWSLLKGRVPGRVDVIVRSRCVGWLQRDSRGRDVACMLDGAVPGSASTNRVQAVTALLAALVSPAPLPELGPEARTPRRPRARSPRERPISPFTPAQLATAALADNLPRLPDGSYRVHIHDGYDDTELGRVYRSGRHWQALNPDGRTVVHRAATRTEAVDRLLATPGPLFGDPADTILHNL
ncbi:hypothetical protein AB0J35_21685 [Nonomuraea angiospora]|uniref:hypothetical protein n=1 Tax=Nonomuraea angiospora TaxID=46172 RepID=UPI00343B95CA